MDTATDSTADTQAPPSLLSSDVANSEALVSFAERQTSDSLKGLTLQQQQRFIALSRSVCAQQNQLASALLTVFETFDRTAKADLVAALKEATGLDVNLNHYLHTEGAEDDDPTETRTLWDAAKANFNILVVSETGSGLRYMQRSSINDINVPHRGVASALRVHDFVRTVRELDLGERLNQHLQAQLPPHQPALRTLHQEQLELALLDAQRQAAIGLSRADAEKLWSLMRDPETHWTVHDIQAGGERLKIPFYTLRVSEDATDRVYSYFPSRPGGALRSHFSLDEAQQSITEQIRQSAKNRDFQWLFYAVSNPDQDQLLSFLGTPPVPSEQLTWVALALYKAFADETPMIERLQVVAGNLETYSLAESLTHFSLLTEHTNMRSQFVPNAVMDKASTQQVLMSVFSETLEMLTLPLAGSVLGLGKLVLTVTMGALAYQTLKARHAWAEGQMHEVVQATLDIADLIISARLQGVAVRLSSKRRGSLLKALDHPHLRHNDLGIHTLYWPSKASASTGSAPRLPLDGAALTNSQLLEKMLPASLRGLEPAALNTALQLSGTRRPALDATWNGAAQSDWPIMHTLKAQKLRHDIDRLSSALDQTQPLPDLADRALPPLLPEHFQASVELYNESGHLLARYTPPSTAAANGPVQLQRVENGHYQALQPEDGDTAQPLLQAALAAHERLTPDSQLGRIGDFSVDEQFANRASQFQTQIHASLKRHQPALFEALLLDLPAAQLPPQHPAQPFAAHAGSAVPAQPAAVTRLIEHFPGLSHAAAAQWVHDEPSLTGYGDFSQLPEALATRIDLARQQNQVIDALGALQDAQDRGLNREAEALLCNLLTLLPDWPAELGISVRGDQQQTRHYGPEAPTQTVQLIEHHGHYQWLNQYDDASPARPGQNSLVSSLLQALDDRQRDAIGYGLDDSSRLGQLPSAASPAARQSFLATLLSAHVTYPLSEARLAHFRQTLDLAGSQPDAQGVHTWQDRLYIEHEGSAYQVLRDLDASTPAQPVLRIVHADDPVAQDPENSYVATRPGRSEAVLRNADGTWQGVLTGGQGGMRRRARANQREIILQTQLLDATKELLACEEQIQKASDQVKRRAQKITDRGDSPDITSEEELEWKLYRRMVDRINGFREEKLRLYEQYRALFKKDDDYQSINSYDEQQCHAQMLSDCVLAVLTLHLEHQARLRPLGSFTVSDIPLFRQHCLAEIQGLSLKLPYAEKTEAALAALQNATEPGFIELREAVIANRPADPYYTRVALAQFQMWLLSVGDPQDVNEPRDPNLDMTELACALRPAAVTLRGTSALPQNLQISVLDSLERQFELMGKELQILGEEYSDPRDLAHIKEAGELIAWFQKEAGERLRERFEAATSEAELARGDDAIDFDFIPQLPGPSQAPTPRAKKLLRYKVRGRTVAVIGTVREEGGETLLDIDGPELAAPDSAQSRYRKDAAGQWQASASAGAAASLDLQGVRAQASNAIAASAQHKAEADAMMGRYDATSIVEQLERRAAALDTLHQQLSEAGDQAHADDGSVLEQLLSTRDDLLAHGQQIKLKMYKNPLKLDMNRLLFLLAHDEVRVEQTHKRKPLGKGAAKHFLDTYRIVDAVDGTPLWAAHFHYATPTSAALDFNFKGGHLKTLAQEHQGAGHQAAEEREGQAITPIWRVTFDVNSARQLFDHVQPG
ncbi:dermonecrotic toxin domain-containing protein [Pseudomonas sp. nanlin1]|uniref:dermonecrotic toxin domain-containing protein n=1 Tax=Pseudomonas sp. nanlin1 TaxID=3040605 RepID=UPI00388EA75E